MSTLSHNTYLEYNQKDKWLQIIPYMFKPRHGSLYLWTLRKFETHCLFSYTFAWFIQADGSHGTSQGNGIEGSEESSLL